MKKEVSYSKVNDGFIYINFTEDIKQMNCVYYPEQKSWYIYQQDKDVVELGYIDMDILLLIIDNGCSVKKFIKIILLSRKKGYYRPSFFYNSKYLIGKYYPKGLYLDPVIKKTINMKDFLNKKKRK